jgi:hypothetical protein
MKPAVGVVVTLAVLVSVSCSQQTTLDERAVRRAAPAVTDYARTQDAGRDMRSLAADVSVELLAIVARPGDRDALRTAQDRLDHLARAAARSRSGTKPKERIVEMSGPTGQMSGARSCPS